MPLGYPRSPYHERWWSAQNSVSTTIAWSKEVCIYISTRFEYRVFFTKVSCIKAREKPCLSKRNDYKKKLRKLAEYFVVGWDWLFCAVKAPSEAESDNTATHHTREGFAAKINASRYLQQLYEYSFPQIQSAQCAHLRRAPILLVVCWTKESIHEAHIQTHSPIPICSSSSSFRARNAMGVKPAPQEREQIKKSDVQKHRERGPGVGYVKSTNTSTTKNISSR